MDASCGGVDKKRLTYMLCTQSLIKMNNLLVFFSFLPSVVAFKKGHLDQSRWFSCHQITDLTAIKTPPSSMALTVQLKSGLGKGRVSIRSAKQKLF